MYVYSSWAALIADRQDWERIDKGERKSKKRRATDQGHVEILRAREKELYEPEWKNLSAHDVPWLTEVSVSCRSTSIHGSSGGRRDRGLFRARLGTLGDEGLFSGRNRSIGIG